MVSVIIPTMTSGFTHLARLMPQLSQEPDCEIIVVDNNSKDGTMNYLSNYNCRVIVNTTNLGFAKANNQASEIARGDYLLFLNNDTVITPGFLRKMQDVFQKDATVGIVGCLITKMEEPKKVQHAGVMFTQDYFPYELGLEIPSIAPGIPFNDPRVHIIREVPAVTAACMMVSHRVWSAVGGFDVEYINGWEDVAFNLRARELGYSVWYTGETSIRHVHFGSRSVGRFTYEKENRAKYERDWVLTDRAKTALKGRREM